MEGDESYADLSCPIAMFDSRQPTQTQTQTQDEQEVPENVAEDKGYSKNTVKALAVIRRELQPNAEEPEEDKYMSFNNMAQKVCG